jgi:hypothetical protein
MPSNRRIQVGALVGLALLATPLLRLLQSRSRSAPHRRTAQAVAQPPADLRPPESPAETALRQAAQWWTRAKLAVNREQERLERWDQQASETVDWEAWRLQEMARDRGGDLRRARALAQQAAAKARTPDEAYRAAEFLVMVQHEAGRHEEEWRQAGRLLELAPGSERAQQVYRRAMRCRETLGPQSNSAGKRTALPTGASAGGPR